MATSAEDLKLVEAQYFDIAVIDNMHDILCTARKQRKQRWWRSIFRGSVESPIATYKTPELSDDQERIALAEGGRFRASTLTMQIIDKGTGITQAESSVTITKVSGDIKYDGILATDINVDERVHLGAAAVLATEHLQQTQMPRQSPVTLATVQQ